MNARAPVAGDGRAECQLRIKAFVEDRFQVSFDGKQLDLTSDLFGAGLIDSFGVVDLVAFLESTFEVAFSEAELTSPEMSSIEGMAGMVWEKVATR